MIGLLWWMMLRRRSRVVSVFGGGFLAIGSLDSWAPEDSIVVERKRVRTVSENIRKSESATTRDDLGQRDDLGIDGFTG